LWSQESKEDLQITTLANSNGRIKSQRKKSDKKIDNKPASMQLTKKTLTKQLVEPGDGRSVHAQIS
jgi:hypothetical protein